MIHPFLDEVMKEIERRNFESFDPYADEQDHSYAESYASQVLEKYKSILDKQGITVMGVFTFIADQVFVKYSRTTYGKLRDFQLPLDDFIFIFISVEELRIHAIESIIND